jgi:hypothetical protein
MATDGNTNRPLLSLILLGIVDFVCILMAAEASRDKHFHEAAIWLIAGIASSAIGYYWSQVKRAIARLGTSFKKKPSKLTIHWANYRAVENGGDVYDVGDFLRQIISGDSLVFDIESHNFVIGDKNFVPRDPLPFKEKRLQVNYSFANEPARTTERREHGRLLLPEDSKIQWLMGEVDRLKAAQPKPAQYPVPQLRSKVVAIVSALQGFLGEYGDEPQIASILSGRTAKEYDQDLAEVVVPWRARVASAYRLRFNDSLPKLRDEIATRARVTDAPLNDLIQRAATESSPDVRIFKDIIQRLWELGIKLNA